MSAWKTSTLGEIISIAGGGTPTRSNPDFYGGTIPWVTPEDMKSWEITGAEITLTQLGVDNSATRVVPKNSILIVVRSGVLKHTIPVGLNRVPVAINQDMKALQCREGIDADYLARFIKARSPVILQWVRATTADNFPIDKLKKLPVPLPPLAEQRRIAEVLDRADALRAKRRATLAQLDSLTQSIFLELFGDPASIEPIHPSQPLESLLAKPLQNGAYFPRERYSAEGGVEMVHMSDAFYETITRGNLKRVKCSDSDIAKYGLTPSDILVARRSLNYEGAAKPCLIPPSSEPLIFESSFIRLTPASKLTVLYLYHYLSNERVRQKSIQRLVTQSTISGINQSNLARLTVIVPPIELQHEFERRVSAVENLKLMQAASLNEINALFSSLTNKAFRGEL